MLEGRKTIDKPEEVYIHAVRIGVPRFHGFKRRT
jgi:hypothetical protein